MEILQNEPMKKHTTMKVGGPADTFITTDSIAAVKKILKEPEPVFILGNGSNIIVRDKGIRGIVLKFTGKKTKVKGITIQAESGIMLRELAQLACDSGLSGLEFAKDIPGTLGGAVYMNAGAWGQSMKDIVKKVNTLDPVFLISDWGKMASNKFKTIGGYEFSYYVMGKECIMLIDGKEHRDIMNLSVPDFLSAIKYSKSVFTNSYHGFCFSIIFDRKAYLIENRPGISTRFETILQVFNAEQTTETTWRVEKGQDRNIIQDGQKKARQFLEDALSDT
jgi:UDP-N-acetylenolpyruvoylglucosamine reductase